MMMVNIIILVVIRSKKRNSAQPLLNSAVWHPLAFAIPLHVPLAQYWMVRLAKIAVIILDLASPRR